MLRFRHALRVNLPASALPKLDKIYDDLNAQLSYDVGSVTRLAIQEAYGYAQTRMLAAGVGVIGLAIIWTFMIRNINLAAKPQVAGMVF